MKRYFLLMAVSVLATACFLSAFQPAYAMQNIKCIKSGANKQLAAWQTEAGGLAKILSSEKLSSKSVLSKLQTLAKDGENLAGICKTCGAEKYTKTVSALTLELKQGLEGFAGEGDVPKELLGTLNKIAALEG